MHQSQISDTIVNDIPKHVDYCDNLIYVAEAEGLGIILVICRLLLHWCTFFSLEFDSKSKEQAGQDITRIIFRMILVIHGVDKTSTFFTETNPDTNDNQGYLK